MIQVAELREEMRSKLPGSIGDYAATLVAALVSNWGGFILHIGDGIASAFGSTDGRPGEFAVVCQSNPKNGEFANQTFYLTGADWIRHIQITPVSSPSLIVMCTDGAQELLYRANEVDARALQSVVVKTMTDPTRLETCLGDALQALDQPAATGDDLGCILIYNSILYNHAGAGTLSFVQATPGRAPLSDLQTMSKNGAVPTAWRPFVPRRPPRRSRLPILTLLKIAGIFFLLLLLMSSVYWISNYGYQRIFNGRASAHVEAST